MLTKRVKEDNANPVTYDVTHYLSGIDHGLILVMTRLANLEQLGESRRLGRLSKKQTQAIFQNQYKDSYGKVINL